MKKTVLLLAGLAVTGSLYAGSIDYLSNQSADYLRTFCRNASTDVDAVHYNPAATAFMKDGIYAQLNTQFIFKDYTATLNTATNPANRKDYNTDYPSLFVPNFYAIFKKSNWAANFGSGIIAGGGTVKFEDGVPFMVQMIDPLAPTDANLEATSLFPFVSLGGAYAINDMISFSLAGRYVYGMKTYKGKLSFTHPIAGPLTYEADAENTAHGFGGIIGIAVKPTPELMIDIRYETVTMLDFETTVNDNKSFNGYFTDGEKTRKDLPATLALGASYRISDLLLSASADIFFIGQADQGKDSETSNGYDDDYDDIGYEISGSAEYTIIPEFLLVSAGYMYNKVGGNEKTYNDFDFSLDSHSVGVGGRVMPMQDLALVLGIGRVMYVDGDNANGSVTFKKEAWILALGAEYKF